MKNCRLIVLLSSAALAAFLPNAAVAQDGGDAEGAVPHVHGPHSVDEDGGVIVVTAGGLDRLDMLAGTSVMDEADLQRNMNGQVGEVLAKLPGVSASGFAPGASRPVLRGFQGERVRVLVDGIGSIDASNTSADHAVTIDPLTAESIEVLRGPAVLIYGSSAIGGAVNVIDRRIPHAMPNDGLRLDGVLSADSASNLREAGASADVSLSRDIAWHVDGSFRETGDLSVPGYVLTDDLRVQFLEEAAAQELAGNDDEALALRTRANLTGSLPDSASRTLSLGTGLTWFGGESSMGASVGYYDTRYGVPTPAEEGVSIDLQQFRADLRGEFHLGEGLFHDLVTRWGYSDYTHSELEGGDVGTTFKVQGVEGRAELIQSAQDLGGDAQLKGSVGGQFYYRDFLAIGDEAFLPPNQTTQAALFTLQELDIGAFEAEMGARWENTRQQAVNQPQALTYNTVSAALGLSWTFDQGIRAGLNLSRAERAPSAEELFVDGPHIATSQYELGDPALVTERAWGLEGYVRASFGGADLRLAAYRNWFDRFIYLEDQGVLQDDLPLAQFKQQNATWSGIEAEANFPLWSNDAGDLVADLRGSVIRATLADGSPVPRIPPLTTLAALEWQGGKLDLRSEVEWSAKQNRVAPLETTTDGFAMVNLSATFRPFADQRLSVMVQADNLFDVEGRRAASFTKDFVPLAGRNFKISLRTRL